MSGIIPHMKEFINASLSHDVIHGYIPFTSPHGLSEGEVSEQTIIDNPWIQRLRQIHQLQTAWWVYPTAEHTRFQHVLGAMHLASRMIEATYESLQQVCPDLPSRGYVESLLRMAALLHDVGHGPFGHFFDTHYLAEYQSEPRDCRQPDHPRPIGRSDPPRAAKPQQPDDRRRASRSATDLLPDHAARRRRPPATARSGCVSSAASSAASTRSITWTSCSATPTCRATASGPSTSTGCCATACSPIAG